jgi:hypothetical protein
MQHLESERIAAFDHDAPTVGELAHLEACATCRAERVAFSALTQRAMQVIDAPVHPSTPRLTNWESLSARLHTEGLIDSVATANQRAAELDEVLTEARATDRIISINAPRASNRSRVSNGWWRMAAAAVLLVAGGHLSGRLSDSASTVGPRSTELANVTSDMGPLGLGNTGYSSVEEASKALTRIEREFNRTATWLTANDPSANAPDVLRRRLAQLDQVMAAAYTASQAAPQDQILDRYYRSVRATREITIQQLGKALPVGYTLERF